MEPINVRAWNLVGIGLGGICEGWLYPLLMLHRTGCLPFAHIFLVDGKEFKDRNRERQYAGQMRNKAQDRVEVFSSLFPHVPLCHMPEYVTPDNVKEIVTEDCVVLLSPDNHTTRKLLSDHAETLANVLLISGGNDGINESAKTSGVEAAVMVHFRREGRNLTPPLTKHHPTIAQPTDRSPHDLGCADLAAAGETQLLPTNLLAGQLMIQLLVRYCTLPAKEATEVVEMWANAREGSVVPYGLDSRPL